MKLPSYLGAFRCHADNKSSTIEEVGRVSNGYLERIFSRKAGRLENAHTRHPAPEAFRFFQHPFLIALPYIYRRFFLRLRGMENSCL